MYVSYIQNVPANSALRFWEQIEDGALQDGIRVKFDKLV